MSAQKPQDVRLASQALREQIEASALQRAVSAWLESVFQEPKIDDLFEFLHDGSNLCRLINAYMPNKIPRFVQPMNGQPLKIIQIYENCTQFLKAARSIGVRDVVLFEPSQLFGRRDLKRVLTCLEALGVLLAPAAFPESPLRRREAQVSAFLESGGLSDNSGSGDALAQQQMAQMAQQQQQQPHTSSSPLAVPTLAAPSFASPMFRSPAASFAADGHSFSMAGDTDALMSAAATPSAVAVHVQFEAAPGSGASASSSHEREHEHDEARAPASEAAPAPADAAVEPGTPSNALPSRIQEILSEQRRDIEAHAALLQRLRSSAGAPGSARSRRSARSNRSRIARRLANESAISALGQSMEASGYFDGPNQTAPLYRPGEMDSFTAESPACMRADLAMSFSATPAATSRPRAFVADITADDLAEAELAAANAAADASEQRPHSGDKRKAGDQDIAADARTMEPVVLEFDQADEEAQQQQQQQQQAEGEVEERVADAPAKPAAPVIDEAMRARIAAMVASTKQEFLDFKASVLEALEGGKQVAMGDWRQLMKRVKSLEEAKARSDKLYEKEAAKRRRLFNKLQELRGNIRVFCRVRPLLKGESGNTTAISTDHMRLDMTCAKRESKSFEFDYVFGADSTQAQVFDHMEPLVTSVLDGYNVCCFAYGQTGSGKTFTMEGTTEKPGLYFRTLDALFAESSGRDAWKYTISVSMVQIYNETVQDLLGNDRDQKLEIRQGANGVYVPNLAIVNVSASSEVLETIRFGNGNRATGATKMNEVSSRSHCIVSVYVQGENQVTNETCFGKLHLVDLAGSERASRSEATGQRLVEAQHINKSLSALGNVVSSLLSKTSHVPYRDSKLTYLLQDSLGGDSKTVMFVNISAAQDDDNETLSSLNFASRVRSVQLGPAKKHGDSGELLKLKKTLKQRDDRINKLEEQFKLEKTTLEDQMTALKQRMHDAKLEQQRLAVSLRHAEEEVQKREANMSVLMQQQQSKDQSALSELAQSQSEVSRLRQELAMATRRARDLSSTTESMRAEIESQTQMRTTIVDLQSELGKRDTAMREMQRQLHLAQQQAAAAAAAAAHTSRAYAPAPVAQPTFAYAAPAPAAAAAAAPRKEPSFAAGSGSANTSAVFGAVNDASMVSVASRSSAHDASALSGNSNSSSSSNDVNATVHTVVSAASSSRPATAPASRPMMPPFKPMQLPSALSSSLSMPAAPSAPSVAHAAAAAVAAVAATRPFSAMPATMSTSSAAAPAPIGSARGVTSTGRASKSQSRTLLGANFLSNVSGNSSGSAFDEAAAKQRTREELLEDYLREKEARKRQVGFTQRRTGLSSGAKRVVAKSSR